MRRCSAGSDTRRECSPRERSALLTPRFPSGVLKDRRQPSPPTPRCRRKSRVSSLAAPIHRRDELTRPCFTSREDRIWAGASATTLWRRAAGSCQSQPQQLYRPTASAPSRGTRRQCDQRLCAFRVWAAAVAPRASAATGRPLGSLSLGLEDVEGRELCLTGRCCCSS